MFMHASWSHILGNMWFLAIFGKNVEDTFGRLRYLAFYVAGGFAAAALQAAITLIAGTAADATVPMLGASGAIAAVLGAYWILYPGARILTIVGIFPVRIPAWVFLGRWFAYQLIEANRRGCCRPEATTAARRSSPTSAGSCSAWPSRWRSCGRGAATGGSLRSRPVKAASLQPARVELLTR